LEQLREIDDKKEVDDKKNEKSKDEIIASINDKFRLQVDNFADTFMKEVTSTKYFYNPAKTILDAKKITKMVRLDISTSSIGMKLENLVTQNLRIRIINKLLGKSSN
jgi:hypothetical protein